MVDSISKSRSHDLWETLQLLPKVDLHRHLEGSLRLETLAEVAIAHGVDLPSYDIEELRPYVQFTQDKPDFHTFLEKFHFLRRFYSTRGAIERVAYEAVADAAADNVRYLELRFSPATLAHSQGFSLEEVTDWVIASVAQAEKDYGLLTRLIITLKREMKTEHAEQVARLAFSRAGRGIVGIDLAGDELNYPLEPFIEIMRQARQEGLGLTVHAGEVSSARGVRQAIEELGTQRIGHGVRAREDPSVMALLRHSGVTLEMCPTSNLHTAAVPGLAWHPLRMFHAQGIKVTVNTDDPSISSTTLTDEYLIAVHEIGLELSHVGQILRNGVEAAFLDCERKQELWNSFRQSLEKLPELSSADVLEAERPK